METNSNDKNIKFKKKKTGTNHTNWLCFPLIGGRVNIQLYRVDFGLISKGTNMARKTINKGLRRRISDASGLIDKLLKADGNEGETRRQTQILWVILMLVLVQLSGCGGGSVVTRLTNIEREPLSFPKIRLDSKNCPTAALYAALVNNSKAMIGSHLQSNYTISKITLETDIDMRFREGTYRLYYEVHDYNHEKVIENFMSRQLKGSSGPYYSDSYRREIYTKFVYKDAAIRLLNDLYRKMPAVVAAEPERQRMRDEEAQRREEAKQKEEARRREEERRREEARRKARQAQLEREKRLIQEQQKALERAEEAVRNNKLYEAISILEEAEAIKVSTPLIRRRIQNYLLKIYQSPEWLAQRPKVCIQKFEISQNLDPAIGGFLYETLMAELTSSPKLAIVDWEELDRLLKFIAKSEPHLSDEDAKRQAMLKLGVKQLYVGSYYKIGRKYYVTLKVLNFNLLVDASYQDSTESEDELQNCIQRIATKIIQSK